MASTYLHSLNALRLASAPPSGTDPACRDLNRMRASFALGNINVTPNLSVGSRCDQKE